MNIIILGAPGAGKGTQARAIANKLDIPHISTGELFRHEMALNTQIGQEITHLMNSGQLVPDELTMKIFEQRISQPDCENGAIMDGVPRTLAQAKMLEDLFSRLNKTLDHVLLIALPENEVITRLSGRWTCPQCNRVYHIKYDPPVQSGICNDDRAVLYQREDQKEDAVKKRLEIYNELTKPLIDFYQQKGLLIEIDGNNKIEKVTLGVFLKLDLKA